MSTISSQTALLAALNPLAGIYNHFQTKSSPFANVPDLKPIPAYTATYLMTIIIIVLVLALILTYFSCKAVYNLTDSVWQTVCYFFFGIFYLYCAILYYGLSGYKFKLSNSSSNSRN